MIWAILWAVLGLVLTVALLGMDEQPPGAYWALLGGMLIGPLVLLFIARRLGLKKSLGYCLIASPFVALFFLAMNTVGLRGTIVVFGLTGGIGLIVTAGVFLACGEKS
jgi:hypothetical protein